MYNEQFQKGFQAGGDCLYFSVYDLAPKLDITQTVNRSISDSLFLSEKRQRNRHVVLQNAQIYQSTEEKVVRETKFADINQKILNTTDVNSALQVAAREIGRALGAPTRITLNFENEVREAE